MSFIDDLINKGKDYISDFSDNQIAEIKDYMGRYNTFEKKIREIQTQINKGSYPTDVIQKFEQIKQRQAVLDNNCALFMKMTDTVADDFNDVQFNYDYIKSKFSKVSEVVSIVYQFFMETKPLIDEQEREIEDIQKLMAGSNPTILNVTNFIKDHWLGTLIGIIVVRKILK